MLAPSTAPKVRMKFAVTDNVCSGDSVGDTIGWLVGPTEGSAACPSLLLALSSVGGTSTEQKRNGSDVPGFQYFDPYASRGTYFVVRASQLCRHSPHSALRLVRLSA